MKSKRWREKERREEKRKEKVQGVIKTVRKENKVKEMMKRKAKTEEKVGKEERNATSAQTSNIRELMSVPFFLFLVHEKKFYVLEGYVKIMLSLGLIFIVW